jgi:hypothetical protein
VLAHGACPQTVVNGSEITAPRWQRLLLSLLLLPLLLRQVEGGVAVSWLHVCRF